MKKVTAIVRPEKLEALKSAFLSGNVSGMTVSQVQGCGNQLGWKEYYRGSEIMLNMLPKLKFEVIITDDNVEDLIALICRVARTGEVGDGKIFVTPIETAVRIRTGERDGEAL